MWFFDIEKRNKRLEEKLKKKQAVAKYKQLKTRLAQAEDATHVYDDYLKDRSLERKIRKSERSVKRMDAQNRFEKAKTENDKFKHIRNQRKLESKRYKRETRKMRTVDGTHRYKSYKTYGSYYPK